MAETKKNATRKVTNKKAAAETKPVVEKKETSPIAKNKNGTFTVSIEGVTPRTFTAKEAAERYLSKRAK